MLWLMVNFVEDNICIALARISLRILYSGTHPFGIVVGVSSNFRTLFSETETFVFRDASP